MVDKKVSVSISTMNIDYLYRIFDDGGLSELSP